MQLDNPAWTPVPSPHYSKGRDPSFPVIGVVQHYTGAGNGRALARWLAASDARVSAHVVITRDGHVVQQVEFGDRAWHAGARTGVGRWKGLPQPTNVNDFTVGVENSNYGRLTRVATGRFKTAYGRPYAGPTPVRHMDHRGEMHWWEPYTDELIDANIRVLKTIADRFPRVTRYNVVGHSDVSPERKSDPGPLWPEEEVLNTAFGLKHLPRPSCSGFVDPGEDRGEFAASLGFRGRLDFYDDDAGMRLGVRNG